MSSGVGPRVPAFVLGKGRNALAACRSLGRRGIRVTLANADPTDPARASRYCLPVTTPSPADEPDAYAEFLTELGAETQEMPVVIPTGDLEVLAMSEHRDRLRERFRFVMADAETVRALLRKDAFAEIAARHGLATPRTWIVGDSAGIESAIGATAFPCVLKPAYSPAWRRVRFGPPLPPGQHGRMKRFVAMSPEDLRVAFEQAAAVDPAMVVQDHVEGGDDALWDVYVYLDGRGDVSATFVIRKRRTWPVDGNGTGSCVESVHAPDLVEQAVAFLRAVGYRGTAAVCFKRSASDGRFVVIEVNARLALHHSLAAHEGVDLTWLSYLDALGAPLPAIGTRHGRARWVSGWEDYRAFRTYQARGHLSGGRWIASRWTPRVGAWLAADDPRPALRHSAAQMEWSTRLGTRLEAGGRRLRSLLGRGLHASGLLPRLNRRRAGAPALVLRYHSVGGDAWLRPEVVVSAEHFAAQVRHLRRWYRVVPIEEVLTLVESGTPAPEGTVAITFDDGYRDNHEVAWPILRREGCPAAIFVVVDSLETGAPPWPQRLHLLLRRARVPHLTVTLPPEGSGSGPGTRRLDLSTGPARATAYRTLKQILGRLDLKAREALLDALAGSIGAETVTSPPEGRMLGWPEARELAEAGITLGSHTMTHPSLAPLSRDELKWELEESRRRLESGLGRKVTLLAYPFGKAANFGAEVKDAVRAAGYRAAYTTLHGSDGPGADPFALRRVKVEDEPAWRFAIRLLTLQQPRPLLEWILKDGRAAASSAARPPHR